MVDPLFLRTETHRGISQCGTSKSIVGLHIFPIKCGVVWERGIVVDGVIPSAYAVGDVDAVEEERRTLYVALTRAKRNLHVLEPIRSHMSDRPVRSDGYVYGTRSRFMSDAVLRTFERTSWPRATKARRLPRRTRSRIDARAKMRSMWE